MRRRVVWATATLGAAGAATFYFSDEGFRRQVIFWKHVGPIHAHYRYVDWSTSKSPPAVREAEFERLHHRYADDLLALVHKLKGFYVKIGQVGATRTDFVPKIFVERLRTLEDAVPPQSGAYVRSVVERSLGKPINELFTEFDEEPLGSASIGQVHRARLLDGREVAVKVQYPGIEKLFRGDIATIRSFCKIAQPEQLPILDEIERQFLTEFDYCREAEHLHHVRHNLRPFRREVVVPEPYFEFCRKDVLVMEYLDGVKLVTALKDQFGRMAARQGKTLDEFIADYRARIEAQGGIYKVRGPGVFRMECYRKALWLWNGVASRACAVWNHVPLLPERAKLEFVPHEVPMNYPRIIDTLLRVHGHEVFVDGFFNGDPHPGNMMMLRDGRLGLIDYGQVKRLTEEQRIGLARLFLAMAQKDWDAVVALSIGAGFRTKHMNPWAIRKACEVFFDRDDPEVTEGMHLQKFVEYLHEVDPVTTTVDDFVMVGRVSFMLRGLGLALQYPLSIATAWRPITEAVLREHLARGGSLPLPHIPGGLPTAVPRPT